MNIKEFRNKVVSLFPSSYFELTATEKYTDNLFKGYNYTLYLKNDNIEFTIEETQLVFLSKKLLDEYRIYQRKELEKFFINFLFLNNALSKFTEILVKNNSNLTDHLNRFPSDNWLCMGFTWVSLYDFWNNLHNKWRKEKFNFLKGE